MSAYYKDLIKEQSKLASAVRDGLEKLSRYEDVNGHEEQILYTARNAELLCLGIRALIRSLCVVSPEDLDIQTCDLMGITVCSLGRGYRITMPPLRRRRNYCEDTAYLIRPLFSAVERFCHENAVRPLAYARINICHYYPPGVPVSALPDYDNFEIKKVFDVLAVHFLIDDNITRCEILQYSREAGEAFTEVTILPAERNPENQWLN